MQWSKTKATIESFLCEKLKGGIKVHATVYRKFHDRPSRVWITLDKKEIVSASDISYAVKYEKVYQQMKEKIDLKGIPYNEDWAAMFNSKERQELEKLSDDAEVIMMNQNNTFESYYLYSAFMKYSSLSIEEAINSENILIRAYAMFDRRLGKRRLKELDITEHTHPLILDFYKIRCDVEGITSEFRRT
ncbi:SF0329 family protein [Fredinandcohnia onubensis]|uniref:SF0329 family protein n=1 Tax=Fredinandcohnia onubensis TaxID=1571209 RepID=UPI000C0BC71F|nr:nonribosomal peptide synthetase [Fredinandcohnia onubensis]